MVSFLGQTSKRMLESYFRILWLFWGWSDSVSLNYLENKEVSFIYVTLGETKGKRRYEVFVYTNKQAIKNKQTNKQTNTYLWQISTCNPRYLGSYYIVQTEFEFTEIICFSLPNAGIQACVTMSSKGFTFGKFVL